jgi:hypothetical protein
MPNNMNFTELYNQAGALKQTAETMIKAGYTSAVESTTQTAAEAILAQAKGFYRAIRSSWPSPCETESRGLKFSQLPR